jgi:hypothetical protein
LDCCARSVSGPLEGSPKINFGIFCAVGFVATCLIVGPPAVTSLGQPHIDKAALKRVAFRGASIGLAAVFSGVIHQEGHALSYGIEVGVVTGILGFAI